MTELASAFPGGWSFKQDAQAQEWAQQQWRQQQQHNQLENQQMQRLQQQNNQNQPLFRRGQENDFAYKTGFAGATSQFHTGYNQRVQVAMGGAQMEQMKTRNPSLVNNYGQKAEASTYDPAMYNRQGGKPADIDFKSLNPDNFTRYQLFYTTSSPYCKNFLHLLSQSPELDKEVQKINVDELRQNGHRVEGLSGVPTIIDRNEPFLGKRALHWLADKTSNQISGFDLDDVGFSPIEQSSSGSAWSETTFSGNPFSYVFEDNQIQDFDVRSLINPMQASGRGAGSSMDQELQRLKSMRDQQIQWVPQRGQGPQQGGVPQQFQQQQQGGGYPPQQQQYAQQGYQQQQQAGYPQQGYQQQGGYPQQQGSGYGQPSGGGPAYNPNGPNFVQGQQQGGGYGQQQQFGGGGGRSGYPQQGGGFPQQQGGGGQGPALPDALRSQNARGNLGPYQGRTGRY